MKKLIFLILFGFFTVNSYSTETVAEMPLVGNGSQQTPYEINTLAHLRWLSETNSVWDNYFIQTSDIDLAETETWNSGEGWMPIGSDFSNPFTGSYDGKHYKIKNLYINREEDRQGFFGSVVNSTIKRVIIENAFVQGEYNTGILAGFCREASIYQCSTTGSVDGDFNVGGLIGEIEASSVKESFSRSIITGAGYLGGLIAASVGASEVENCYSRSFISTESIASLKRGAGIVALVISQGLTVSNSYFAGEFRRNINRLLGITAWGEQPSVYNSFWDSDLIGEKPSDSEGVGKTSNDMKDPSTFIASNWDFSEELGEAIWNHHEDINNGYPFLSWEHPYIANYNSDNSYVYIDKVTTLSTTSANVSAQFEKVGVSNIIDYGVCWSEEENATVENNILSKGGNPNEGTFNVTINGLNSNKTYFLNTFYIKEDNSVKYGKERTFRIYSIPSGEGTISNPYVIDDFFKLMWITEDSDRWSKHYIQTADIDAQDSRELNKGEGFMPIGNSKTEFTGSYDGNFKNIENLYISRPFADNQGLFGNTKNAQIKNIILADAYVEGFFYVGGVVANAENSTISNCAISGNIIGFKFIGAAGRLVDSEMKSLFIDSTIEGIDYIGSFAGYFSGSTLSNSYSRALFNPKIFCSSYGGIIGDFEGEGLVEYTYFAGEQLQPIMTHSALILSSLKPEINNVYWDNEVFISIETVGEGKTTADMKELGWYLLFDWDFKGFGDDAIWNIRADKNDGYPYLNWQYPEDEAYDGDIASILMLNDILRVDNQTIKIFSNVAAQETTDFVEYGICWNNIGEPNINSNNKIVLGTELSNGNWSSIIDDFNYTDVYYVKLYAIHNNSDVLYSKDYEFINTLEPEGEGSEANPYLIETLLNLKWIAYDSDRWDKHYLQTSHIDAIDTHGWRNGWRAIGHPEIDVYGSFRGVYDGAFYKIENLYLDTETNSELHGGLFYKASSAEFKNIVIENAFLHLYENGTGGILVSSSTQNYIYRCYVSGDIMYGKEIGGIVGFGSAHIEESVANVDMFPSKNYGGIAGNSAATILNCYSRSNIYNFNSFVLSFHGGGIADMASEIKNSYHVGDLYVEQRPPSYQFGYNGVLGYQSYDEKDAEIINSFWNGDIINIGYKGTKSTTAEMKNKNTYTNLDWDFVGYGDDGVWDIDPEINDGYPYLAWMTAIFDPVSTSKKNKQSKETITVYPNPFESTIYINGDNIKNIKIYSLVGSIVYEQGSYGSDNVLYTSFLDPGVYSILIELENGDAETSKLIKVR